MVIGLRGEGQAVLIPLSDLKYVHDDLSKIMDSVNTLSSSVKIASTYVPSAKHHRKLHIKLASGKM